MAQEWEKLYNFQTDKKVFVIVNISNGPSTGPDSNFLYAISKLKSKGFYVLGYVYTLYSQRNIDEVKNDINNWLSFYPNMIDGFFVDEVVNGSYDYYSSIYSYIKSLSNN